MKRVCAGKIGFWALCLSLVVQPWCYAQTNRSLRLDDPALVHGSMPEFWSNSILPTPLGFAWMLPPTPLPSAPSTTSQTVSVAARTGSPQRVTEMLPQVDYATAEVGFLYGRSTGKFGGDLKEGYIIGEVGNDKLHISVGAAYQDSSFRLPRSR